MGPLGEGKATDCSDEKFAEYLEEVKLVTQKIVEKLERVPDFVVKQLGDSQLWSGLMDVKEYLLARGKFVVKNGEHTRFWEDWWVGHKPLMK